MCSKNETIPRCINELIPHAVASVENNYESFLVARKKTECALANSPTYQISPDYLLAK